MAMSAPTTPAHASRPLNLPSESSAWLDEVTSASTLQVDILNGNQNTGFDSNSNSVVDDLIELEKNGLDRLVLTADAAQMIEAPPANLVQYLDKEQQIRAEYLNEMQHEYQNWRKSLPFNSLNDTDDAKALLPSFLMESPFDTGVTRRVKRAYSTVDAVSIRIGVFFETISVSKNF